MGKKLIAGAVVLISLGFATGFGLGRGTSAAAPSDRKVEPRGVALRNDAETIRELENEIGRLRSEHARESARSERLVTSIRELEGRLAAVASPPTIPDHESTENTIDWARIEEL